MVVGMIEIFNGRMYLDERDSAIAGLAFGKSISVSHETNQYLGSIENRLKADMCAVGVDSEAALPFWERVSRLQAMSGVIVANMVGGEVVAAQVARADAAHQPPHIAA